MYSSYFNKQFLFSLSLNPPPKERVPTEAFESAINAVEQRLGLVGQPRIIAFHEKDGRRHAHAVWSRIDTKNMKANRLYILGSFLKIKPTAKRITADADDTTNKNRIKIVMATI